MAGAQRPQKPHPSQEVQGQADARAHRATVRQKICRAGKEMTWAHRRAAETARVQVAAAQAKLKATHRALETQVA